MSPSLQDRLHDVQRIVRTRPLFTMRLDTKLLVIGATPITTRRIGVVAGGTFEGEQLSGRVLDGGSDWQSIGRDGSTLLDVRLHLETDDGALICVTCKGIRHGPRDVIKRLEKGEAVDPTSYYFRINPIFETGPKNMAGSTGSLRSESATGLPMARSTTFSSCSDRCGPWKRRNSVVVKSLE